MQTIAKKSISQIRFLVGTLSDISLRYNNITKHLTNDDLYTLFAEPITAGNAIVWRTPLKGKITPFNKLSDVDQQTAKSLLSKTASTAKFYLSEKNNVFTHLDDYLTIPSDDDIYLVKTDDTQKIVLTNWGCTHDDAQKKALKITVGDKFPVPVKFKLLYSDNTIAAHEKTFIAYNNIEKEVTADENAIVDFGETLIGTKLSTHQIINNEKSNIQQHTCDGRNEYIVNILASKTMIFLVKYDTGELKPNSKFTFEYENQKDTFVSNEEGRITIENIKLTTKVKTYKQKGYIQDYMHNFVCEADKDVYEIIIPRPVDNAFPEAEIVTKNLNVKLIDNKRKPISAVDIDFKIKNETTTQKTNDEGNVTIINSDIDEHTPIAYQIKYGKHKIPLNYRYKSKVYEVNGDKKTTSRKLNYKSTVESYEIMIKKRCLWCLLLLLLPLLLLIRLNQNIDYILMNSCDDKIVPDTEVAINYKDSQNELHNISKTTNDKGEVSFSIKGRRLYEIIFSPSDASNYEITANALSSGTVLATHTGLLQPLSEQQNELIINITEEFVVNTVSKTNTSNNIPQANVLLKYYIANKETTLTATSDSLGLCKFGLPVCAAEIELYATKSGYAPDSISTNLVSAKANPDKRQLKLTALEPEPPRENCRAFFTDNLVDDGAKYSAAYVIDAYSDYVGAGDYPDASIAFPNAARGTFDGIAIANGTKVIIFKEKNFQGKIVFERTGPLIINNKKHKIYMPNYKTKTFKEPIQTLFPPETREWSESDMNSWSNGSVRVLCQ